MSCEHNIMDNPSVAFKARLITNVFERRLNSLFQSMELTAAQSFLLGHISRMAPKPVYQRDLELEFGIKHPTATGIVSRLEDKGFVKCSVSETDRRLKLITPTEKAMSVHKEVSELMEKTETQLTDGLTHEELQTLRSLLNKVIGNFSASELRPQHSVRECTEGGIK